MKNKKEPHDQAGAYIDVRDCLIVRLCRSYSLNGEFLLAIDHIFSAAILSARFRGFAGFGFFAMARAAAFGLFGFGFCHKISPF